jgi:hypothetical protein
LFISACARLELTPDEIVPVRPTTAAALAEPQWSVRPGHYRVRMAFVLDYHGRKIPMTGFLDLDTGARRARFVGLADTGPTLFDAEVEPGGEKLINGIEPFKRFPELTAFVTGGIRRIFLDPAPSAGDTLALSETYYRLTRWRGDERLTFIFAGDGRLLSKAGSTPDRDWSVRYASHRVFDGLPFPTEIKLRDLQAGGSLTLRIETVRRIDNGD